MLLYKVSQGRVITKVVLVGVEGMVGEAYISGMVGGRREEGGI